MKGAFKLRPKSGEFSSPQLPTAAAANESLAKSVMDKAASLKGTFKRKKDRNSMSLMNSWREEDAAAAAAGRSSTLPPPMPPIAPTQRLKRVNSSTMSLGRNKKKMLTLEELYVEILYCILHMIGCDAERGGQAGMIEHLKEAFHMKEEKHKQLLDIATMREEPYLKANLEIKCARELIGKDMSGSSDPFCTFYLTTNPLSRFNTSYKPKTLDPEWNEEFVLDVNSIESDSLRIDVWDFNPEENVSDKFRKISEIKDGRGLRKFIKETLNASAGKITHELIGSVEIPLREVPSSGMIEKWLPLEKPEGAKSKRQRRGDVNVSLLLSTEKDQNLTSQEHKHLLKILFAYELQRSQEQPFKWNGTFCKESVTILAQHAVQGKLTGSETALARWLVYAHTHCDLPLDYRVFHPILEKLNHFITTDRLHQEDEAKFMETAVIFTYHATEFIRQHRHYTGSDETMSVQLEYILKCLALISSCVEGRDLPTTADNSLDDERHMVEIARVGNMKLKVMDAVTESFQHWYQFMVDSIQDMDESSTEQKVKKLVHLVHLVLADLKTGCAEGQTLFKDTINVNYKQLAFAVYQKAISVIARELIESSSKELRPLVFTEDSESEEVRNTINVGTSLFELYLALQQLEGTTKEVEEGSELSHYHIWFNSIVTRWLDIALYKAMQRIIKAVQLDALEPVDELVKHTSSAVDIKTVLLQIKTFWRQLNWPDVEASYAFISKILDDVCKTSIFYADHMCRRVNQQQQQQATHEQPQLQQQQQRRPRGTKFVVTPKLCLAINNIDFVLEFIGPFAQELGLEETLTKLEALNGEAVAVACRRTLNTLVQNATENVENKIFEVLDLVGEKMAPVIQKFLVESSSLVTYAGRDKETLLQYLDKNMIILKEELNQKNFERVLSLIWESSAQSLNGIIMISIDRQKPPSYFKTLLDILKILIVFFYGEKLPEDETLLKMRSLLQLYASDSSELISRYLWERHRQQKDIREGEYSLGSVTIRCQMLREHLRVEVLNARHLKPSDANRINHDSNKGNVRLLRSGRARRYPSANLYRSSLNLDWVKSKFALLRCSLHEASLHLQAHGPTSADPYVVLRLVPQTKFPGWPKFRTRVQRRTLFPLFDETFDFVHGGLSSTRLYDSYLLVSVKARGLMGNAIFLGEALVPLKDIPATGNDANLADLPQMQIPLSKPTDLDSDIMLALESRNFDRVARDFLEKERKKL